MRNICCVVTWFGKENYGTNLQAYALKRKLSTMGYDVYMYGIVKNTFSYYTHPARFTHKVITKIIDKQMQRKRIPSIDRTTESNRVVYDEQVKAFKEFMPEFDPILVVDNQEAWDSIRADVKAFITGSDQVWNPNHFAPYLMLDFLWDKDIKKIAYGPSLGVTKLDGYTRLQYRRLIKSYDAIGVREENGKELLKNLTDLPIEIVVDPTMLIPPEDWHSFADEANSIDVDNPFILCYFVGNNDFYYDYVKEVQNNTGMKCVIIPQEGRQYPSNYHVIPNAGPREFVDLIRKANIVCTDSFHASVFSIIFSKAFYVLQRFKENDINSQNSRLLQLLHNFSLEDHLVENNYYVKKDIDYIFTQRELKKLRERSEQFLKNAIEGSWNDM